MCLYLCCVIELYVEFVVVLVVVYMQEFQLQYVVLWVEWLVVDDDGCDELCVVELVEKLVVVVVVVEQDWCVVIGFVVGLVGYVVEFGYEMQCVVVQYIQVFDDFVVVDGLYEWYVVVGQQVG